MPGSTILDIPLPEQEWRLAEVRRARYSYLLALPVLRLGAAGRTPTESATCLFCSRSRVYRMVNAYHAHLLDARFDPSPPQASWRSPSVRRSLVALLKQVPAVYGWCRTRWSCAPLAAQLQLQRGIVVSASTMRRWLHAEGWGWKRAQVVARDDDPQRIEKLARIRHVRQTLGQRAVVLFADELDIPLRLRQLCWAHLRRDFQAMIDRGGAGEAVGRQLLEYADVLFGWWYWVRDGTWTRSTFRRYVGFLRGLVREELEAGTHCACPKTAATCRELRAVEPALWTFVRVAGIEPTNNAAERALRHAVQWRKTSYGTESATGSHFVENILTVLTTCRQQERNVLNYLTQCCQALYADTEPPSLLPQTSS